MDDEFYYSSGIIIPASVEISFALGMFDVIINGVVLYGVGRIYTYKEGSIYRMVFVDRYRENTVAFINAEPEQKFIIKVSKYPKFHLYHMSIKLK